MDLLHPLHEIVKYRENGARLEICVDADVDKKALLARIQATIDDKMVINADIASIRKAILGATGEFSDIGPLFEIYAPLCDTYLILTTSPLRCTLTIKMDLLDNGIRPTVNIVKHRLKRANVIFGIKEDVIGRIIEKKLWESSVVIAEGIEPIRGENGGIEYKISTEAIYAPKINEHGIADYRDIQSFTQVKAGDLIAVRIPEGKGTPGTSIFGSPLPAEPGKPYELRPAANIIVTADKNELRAECSGIIIKKDGFISIKNDLEIKGNVDFKVGNISFTGKIIINGDVLPGFKIESESDILIHGQVEASTVISTGGTVQIEKGIIGKDTTKIFGKNRVVINFAQDAQIISEGEVIVETNLLRCKVMCNEFKVTGTSSAVIGGEVIAYRSISLVESGNEEETHTELKIMDRKVIELIEKRKKLSEALAQLNELYVPAEREMRNKASMIKKAGIYATDDHKTGLEQSTKRFETVKMKTEMVEKNIDSIDTELKRDDILEGDLYITGAIHIGTTIEVHKKRLSVKKNDHAMHYTLKDGQLAAIPIRK